MHRRLLFLSLFILFCTASFAQQTLKIKVLENRTRVPLPNVKVQNLSTKQSTVTDAAGAFSIKAKLNDLLVLTSFAYQNDTLYVTDLGVKEILMEPKSEMLKEVKVNTITGVNVGLVKGGTPEFHNQTVVYQRDERGFYKGGVAFRVFSSKGGERKRQADAQKEYTEAVRQDIDKVFSPKNLANYLPLKPDELEGFKMNYVPSVATYISPRFNLMAYIDSCYGVFKTLPAEQRVLKPLDSH